MTTTRWTTPWNFSSSQVRAKNDWNKFTGIGECIQAGLVPGPSGFIAEASAMIWSLESRSAFTPGICRCAFVSAVCVQLVGILEYVLQLGELMKHNSSTGGLVGVRSVVVEEREARVRGRRVRVNDKLHLLVGGQAAAARVFALHSLALCSSTRGGDVSAASSGERGGGGAAPRLAAWDSAFLCRRVLCSGRGSTLCFGSAAFAGVDAAFGCGSWKTAFATTAALITISLVCCTPSASYGTRASVRTGGLGLGLGFIDATSSAALRCAGSSWHRRGRSSGALLARVEEAGAWLSRPTVRGTVQRSASDMLRGRALLESAGAAVAL